MAKILTIIPVLFCFAFGDVVLASAPDTLSQDGGNEERTRNSLPETKDEVSDSLEASVIHAIGKPGEARAAIAEALGDQDLSRVKRQRLEELDALSKAVIEIDKRILESFKYHIGKAATAVQFKKSTQRVKILSVGTGNVGGVRDRNGTKAAMRFSVNDLSLNEKLKRVGVDSDGHINIIRAFTALPNTRAAVALLKRDDDKVSAASVDELASRAIGQMLNIAGYAADQTDPLKLAEEIENSSVSPKQSALIKKHSAYFRKVFAGTPALDEYVSLISALSGLRVEQVATQSGAAGSESRNSGSLDSSRSIFDKGPKVELKVKKHKRALLAGGWDYDDKIQRFQFEVIVRSNESATDYNGMNATLYVFGVYVNDRRQFEVEDIAKSQFDPSAGAEHTFLGNAVVLEYDDNKYAQFGVKYGGYALVVKDSNGEVFDTRGSSLFLSNIKALDDLNRGQTVTKRFLR